MKKCSRCQVEKDESNFRWRNENRRGHCVYLNSTCRECESQVQNLNYFAKKGDPEFIDKWKKKSREYYHAHKEEVKQKMKIKRQTPEYKEMMRVYREKNKNKISGQEKITKKRYQEKNKNEISDMYCLAHLGLTVEEKKFVLEQFPEVIEAKRMQLQFHRTIFNKP